jgi:hypothetical protein
MLVCVYLITLLGSGGLLQSFSFVFGHVRRFACLKLSFVHLIPGLYCFSMFSNHSNDS